MPSHIYYRLGRYQDSIEANFEAVEADEAYLGEAGDDGLVRFGYYPHNVHFLLAPARAMGDLPTIVNQTAKLESIIDVETGKELCWVQAIYAAPYFAYALLARRDPGPHEEVAPARIRRGHAPLRARNSHRPRTGSRELRGRNRRRPRNCKSGYPTTSRPSGITRSINRSGRLISEPADMPRRKKHFGQRSSMRPTARSRFTDSPGPRESWVTSWKGRRQNGRFARFGEAARTRPSWAASSSRQPGLSLIPRPTGVRQGSISAPSQAKQRPDSAGLSREMTSSRCVADFSAEKSRSRGTLLRNGLLRAVSTVPG
jgi:hypothetical protein